ncbi:MAG: prepilin-type N-terminal cleavage/methylation domain-containing protein [Candidatus Campbellbacteria bacterium]|nr:prepilin-type N-terminal cleavage/methylation domain-containing protein [Candidatus Campbellbacteria bacterium]
MFNISKNNYNKGFSISEVIIALAIITIAVGAPITLITREVTENTITHERVVAQFIAQETIENIRKIRDSNFIAQGGDIEKDWLDNLTDCVGKNKYCTTTFFNSTSIPNNGCNSDINTTYGGLAVKKLTEGTGDMCVNLYQYTADNNQYKNAYVPCNKAGTCPADNSSYDRGNIEYKKAFQIERISDRDVRVTVFVWWSDAFPTDDKQCEVRDSTNDCLTASENLYRWVRTQ